ncbi:MAG: DUF4139 domain-containing protein [Magnetococcales bacterium]|nr:DUF4139 domain-containing protein [Magnetococcales bacterium]
MIDKIIDNPRGYNRKLFSQPRVFAGFAIIGLFLSYFSSTALGSDSQERTVSLKDQKSVSVTIYNTNLALIKDLRNVTFNAGVNRLALRGVSAKIRPQTALLKLVKPMQGFHVLEQNFDFDLLSPAKLLEKYVGRNVQVITQHPTTGVEIRESAVVLSANSGVVLKIGDRIETGHPGRLVFDNVPKTLRDKPTLSVYLKSPKSTSAELELSYLTGGLSWKADYVGKLDNTEKFLDLNGWVTLTNRSGTPFKQAKLQLVAGDVNRVTAIKRALPKSYMARTLVMEDAAPSMQQEKLFDYHLYTLSHPTTIRDNQSKQVALLSATEIPVHKQYSLGGQQYYYQRKLGDFERKLKIGVFVSFENLKASHLGIPLPAGVVRIYKGDSQGGAQFIGEDRVDHTPKNEKVNLKLGNAFDLTAHKKQTKFNKKPGFSKHNYTIESNYEITLKNAGSKPVTITVIEPIPGDWTMISQSHPHKKSQAHTATWQIQVPAEGKTVLSYGVRVKI